MKIKNRAFSSSCKSGDFVERIIANRYDLSTAHAFSCFWAWQKDTQGPAPVITGSSEATECLNWIDKHQIEEIDFDLLQPHPLADVFPMIDQEGLKYLAEDIKENDLQELILIYDDQILDGRNRYSAIKMAEVPVYDEMFTYFNGTYEAAEKKVYSLNVHRRRLGMISYCFGDFPGLIR